MQTPIPMLRAPGGAKTAAVLAMLAGLVIMTAMQRPQPQRSQQRPQQAPPPPMPGGFMWPAPTPPRP